MRYLSGFFPLPHISGVAERIAAGLGPDAKAVRLLFHRDGRNLTRGGVDGIDGVVKAARKPQGLSINAHIAHIRAAAAGDRPGGDELARGEFDHRYAALASMRPEHMV